MDPAPAELAAQPERHAGEARARRPDLSEAAARRLAKALFGFMVVSLVLSIAFAVLDVTLEGAAWDTLVADLVFLASFLLFPVVGLLIATRRPGNALGWVLLAIGIAAFLPLDSYGSYAIHAGLPGGVWAIAFASWTWVPMIGLAGIFLLLLFPDGHLPSPRWRWFAMVAATGMTVASVAILFVDETLDEVGFPGLENPFHIAALAPILSVGYVGIIVIPVSIIGAAISLVIRYRRGEPTERAQIRWLATAALIVAVAFAFAMIVSISQPVWEDARGWVRIVPMITIALFGLLPVTIGVAVLRHRLFGIDVVVRKTVIVTTIAVFFTLVYVAVVGGIGTLVEAHSTPVLSFLAAALVAISFQPALARARRIADRLVYGKRATPYEVLSEFSDRVGAAYASEDVLPRMARIVGEGVGATRVDVWLRHDDRLRVAASWPGAPVRTEAPALEDGGRVPPLPGAEATYPVKHHGELLGALALAMPANDPMNEAKTRLVADLVAQAGLVLRNVRLTEDLRARLEDLRAAQKRLVEAQDQERRRLERNIHDGAQQQLVALTVKLRLAEGLIDRDPAKATGILRDLQGETQTALEDLRDLARGIYPPLLADQGLAAALEAQARRSPLPVEISPDGLGRYPAAVEAAVYFSCLEALQNVAKYAEATRVEVRLSAGADELRFEVTDDGRGFDPSDTGYGTGLQGIADRLSALDGRLDVRSGPGSGTTVAGRIPLGAVS